MNANDARPPRRVVTARLRPRTIQLCAHCQHNPAGFWVRPTTGQTVRRSWCLSCCQHLDPNSYHLIPFDSPGQASPVNAHCPALTEPATARIRSTIADTVPNAPRPTAQWPTTSAPNRG